MFACTQRCLIFIVVISKVIVIILRVNIHTYLSKLRDACIQTNIDKALQWVVTSQLRGESILTDVA